MAETAEIFHFPPAARRSRSVNSWRWNELEEDALADLPHEAQILYLRVIRKHMDYATGITGEKRRISYAQMQEALSYKPSPHSGEKPVEFSRDQIKRLVQKLVKVGLIERRHDTAKGVAPMILFLPLACCDLEQPRHEGATATAPQANPRGRASGEVNRATCAPHENGEPRHPSGSGTKPSLPSEESVAASKPKRRQWGEEIDHELAEWIASVVDHLPGGSEKRSMTSWANTVRLMREQDGREPEHIRRLFEWASQHEFWQANILSPAKLRKQWKTLALQFNRDRNGDRHEKRHSADQQRTERDRVAASLADPYDTSWADGLFDEGGAQGGDPDAGESGVHSHGGDFPQDLAPEFHDRGDAAAGEAGACVIDGELVLAAEAGASRHDH